MTATPTISITGIVTNVIMTPVSGTNSYTYAWDTSSGNLSDGAYIVTVAGADTAGNQIQQSYIVLLTKKLFSILIFQTQIHNWTNSK